MGLGVSEGVCARIAAVAACCCASVLGFLAVSELQPAQISRSRVKNRVIRVSKYSPHTIAKYDVTSLLRFLGCAKKRNGLTRLNRGVTLGLVWYSILKGQDANGYANCRMDRAKSGADD